MSFQPLTRSALARIAVPALACTGLAGGALAQQQVHFSVDWMGPTVGVPDGATLTPITEGDILVPTPPAIGFAPLPAPSTAYHAGFAPIPGLGLVGHAGCVGHPGGTPCTVEVDALSFGQDQLIQLGVVFMNSLAFSTDEFAVGFAGLPAPPTIWTEAPVGDLCADILVDAGLGFFPAPAPFGAVTPGSVAFLDGDGAISGAPSLYPGIGLREPRPPSPFPVKPGDNLDALEIDPGSATGAPPPLGFFFSLDAGWIDPLTGIPHSGSAAAHGFAAADVLNTPVPGFPPLVYAPGPLLGLDLIGPGQDDLDALILVENGVPGYQPSMSPGDWGAAGGSDMLLFSVRRGSLVVGMPDSLSGTPIEPGDVLSTPVPTFLGGVSPFPSIVIAAENLGLSTLRSGGPGPFGDDLNALDNIKPFFDCDGNGVEDAIDIALGGAADTNGNGIPDSCEPGTGITYSCFCPAPLGPCGNHDATAGCRNSSGLGALMTATGSNSVGADDLVLTTTQAPINVNGILFMGDATILPTPFGDGRRCVSGNLARYPFQNSGGTGTFTYGPGLSAYSIGNFPVINHLLAGTTWNFQMWFRDPPGPCGNGFNLSNMTTVPFVP